MNYPNITFMIDSASRPFLLEKSVPTMYKNLKYSGKIYWVMHETFLFPDLSNECIQITKNKFPFVTKIVEEHFPKGQGNSISDILEITDDEYFIHWEDDYEAVREIDLNLMIKIMEENNDVNQIIFHRRDIMVEVSGWNKKEVERSSQILTTSPHWRFTPALWRVSFIKKYWKRFGGNNSHWILNSLLKQVPLNPSSPDKIVVRDASWIENNIGTYYFGEMGHRAYVQHIGRGFSNRK